MILVLCGVLTNGRDCWLLLMSCKEYYPNMSCKQKSSCRKDVMFSINLKDASFEIPVHPDYRPYLRFVLSGMVYKFKASCFGLLSFPLFNLVSEWAHKRGIWLLCYLDDWLVVLESVPPLLHRWVQLLQFCPDLGIVINWEESDLDTTNRAQYLGMLIDTI